MQKIYTSLVLVCLIYALPLQLFSQKLKEDFSSDYIYDWYVRNTSSPQPAQEADWQFGTWEPYAGAEYGNSNLWTYVYDMNGVSTRMYRYACAGYTEYDYDGADLGKWFITPVLFNIKNGDQFQFITRAQPDRADIERAFSLIQLDAAGLLSCNRPNRLEVRLNNYDETKVPLDSINVGRLPNENGHFDKLLLSINPSLTLDGYSQEWTTYTITISGLTENQVFNGRIGFKYYITNAGYNKCQNTNQLPAPVSFGLDVVSNEFEKAEKPIQYATFAYDIAATLLSDQKGKNGTYIGVDNLLYTSSVAIVDKKYDKNGNRYFWDKNNIGSGKTIDMGYQGKPGCSAPSYPYDEVRYFYVENGTEQPVTVNPKSVAMWNSGQTPLTLEFDSAGTTIPPGGNIYVTAKLKTGIPEGLYYNAFKIEGTNGENLGQVNFQVHIDPPRPPDAKCSPYTAFAMLDDHGNLKSFDIKDLDGGSTNSCGGQSDLVFSLLDSNKQPLTTIGCDQLGTQDVYLLVMDTTTDGQNYCKAKLEVNTPLVPVIQNNVTQQYYLPAYQGTMPLSSVTTPPIIAGCSNVTPTIYTVSEITNYGSGSRSVGLPDALETGTYTLSWKATDKAGNTGYQTSTLNVIDTLAPRAYCNDTAEIGYTFYIPEYGYFIKTSIKGADDIDASMRISGTLQTIGIHGGSYDNTRTSNNPNINKYLLSTTWKGYTTFSEEIPFTCADAGAEFPVTMRIEDPSGNFATCKSYVKIKKPDQATCKNISVDLDTTTGVKNIVTSDVLLNGGDGICGISNSSVSKTQFTCADVNVVNSVDVYYLDAANQEHHCVATVKVNEYSQAATCTDTITLSVPYYKLSASLDLGPVVSSVCSQQLSWDFASTGVNTYNATQTGSYTYDFNPGISEISRTTIYLSDTFSCKQTVYVQDTISPTINSTPSDENIQLPSLSTCTYSHEIVNPFLQESYTRWSYSLSGATSGSRTFEYNTYYYDSSGNSHLYYENQWVGLNPGLTTIDLKAWDRAGNLSEVTYTVNLAVQNATPPYVSSAELDSLPNHTLKGDFCGEEYLFHIDSPVQTACPQDTFMWYFEVRDSFNGNILYEKDSIPQSSGADIPLKVSPKYNQFYSRYVYFGYHDKTNGSKTYSTNQIVAVVDTLINALPSPGDEVIQNDNTVDYTYSYTIPSPIANGCTGSFWGFSVSGATNFKTTDQGVSYNSNQQITLGLNDLSDRYPSLAYNENYTIKLNPGKNIITYRVLEESGNVSLYIKETSFKIEVMDVSVPAMTCPPNDTIHRSTAGPCTVTIGGPCQQVSGFVQSYGLNELGIQGGNANVTIDYSAMPQSVRFVDKVASLDYSDTYITIIAECDGTISFHWEYQSANPSKFRPFINYNSFDPGLYSQPAISGFGDTTSVQTGTYSQAVTKGQYVIIGVTEGGTSNGYFKISNFSGPYFDASLNIAQPTFATTPYLSAYNNLQTEYSIGNHQIVYNLLNLNNGKITQCFQTLTVIDDFATTLTCSNTTLYLNNGGVAVLDPTQVISSCFDVSNTTVSKDTFGISDLGTQNIVITSIDQGGTSHTCNFNLTVLDTIPPVISAKRFDVYLNSGNTGTITDSSIRSIMFDNCGIKTVTLSQTSFDCSNVGQNTVTVTATDSSGNTSTADITVSVYPEGFNSDSQDETIDLCVGEAKSICSPFGSVNNPLEFQWQTKEPVDSLQALNPAQNLPPNSAYHKFFRLKVSQYQDNTYMVHSESGTDLYFKVYNAADNTWDPVFQTLSTPDRNFDANYFMDAFDIDNSPYVVYLNNVGAVKVYRYAVGQWQPVDDSSLFYTINQNFSQLFHDDGYFFPVLWDGTVHAAKEYYTGISELEYIYTPSASLTNSYVTNAQNIVGIRNSNNVNYFFRLNLNPKSMDGGGAFLPMNYGGKDSLTVDPTGNSDVFAMASFQNEAYIAYKSASGKVSVQKFDGVSNWSPVGNPDFSDNPINKVDLEVIDGSLHVAYIDNTNELIVKKWTGSEWITKGKKLLAGSYDIMLVDLNGDIAVYTNGTLLINDGWIDIPNSYKNCYALNTSAPSTSQYRSIVTKYNCATQISSVTTVIIRDIPRISVTDTSIVGIGSATLKATKNLGTVNWLDSLNNLVSNDSVFQTPVLTNDAQYKVFASNVTCYSDTLTAHVFVNNDTIQDITITHSDTLCSGENSLVYIENPQAGYEYVLYKQSGNDFTPVDGPTPGGPFSINPDKTGTYKIKAIEPITDASLITYNQDYIQFSQPSLNIVNQVTIEAWVRMDDPTPATALGHLFGTYTATTYDISWEWGKYFKIYYEGGALETLVFPDLTASQVQKWVHVATTAGPDGMAIYYDGVLVASQSYSHTENIKASAGNLAFGIFGTNDYSGNPGDKSMGFTGLDEVRVWNTERTAAEIKDYINTCLTGTETGLVLYNKFDVFNSATHTFTSVLGTDATVINPSYSNTAFRSGACYPTHYNERFFDPFQINVLQGKSQITSLLNFYDTQSDSCGGEVVEVYGAASAGTLTWYDSETGGNILGTGDTLRMFFARDTIIYAQASPACQRGEVDINVNAAPVVFSTSADPICSGDYLSSSNLDAVTNNDASGYDWFDAPIGGNLIDNNPQIFNTDTLYAEAYFALYAETGKTKVCVSPRVPVYINVDKPTLTSYPNDTTICGGGRVTLKATTENGVLDWLYVYNPPLSRNQGSDSVFTTDSLTRTSLFKVGVIDSNNCSSVYQDVLITVQDLQNKYDTVLSCSAYTWMDGNTYTTSNPDITFVKQNPGACDSVYHLNLTINNLSDNSVSISKTSLCVGEATGISVSNTKTNTAYSLINTADSSVVAGPVTGNDSTVTFSTGALTDTTNFRIMLQSTLVSGTQSLSCVQQLGEDITIPVGTKSSLRKVSRCGSYFWNDSTYTQSGLYSVTLTSSGGCDSIAQLDLTIQQATSSVQDVTACESYTWHDSTYTASTTTTWTGPNFAGCDSVVTLNLTILKSMVTDTSITACDSLVWEGTTYTQSGNYTKMLTSSKGCDSTVTVHLTLNPGNGATIADTACGSYNWYGNTYTTSGSYTKTLTNKAGCDSMITLKLTIHPNPDVAISEDYGNNLITANATGLSYQWIDCSKGGTPIAGETGQTYTYSSPGQYAVIVDDGVCKDTSVCTNDLITGVLVNESSNKVSAYPIPTFDNVFIEFDAPVMATYTVKNVLGVTTQTGSINDEGLVKVNLSGASGVYMVEVLYEKGEKSVLRVIKQ